MLCRPRRSSNVDGRSDAATAPVRRGIRGAKYRSTPEPRACKKEYMKTYNWNYAATVNGQLTRFRAQIHRSIRVAEFRLGALANELENLAGNTPATSNAGRRTHDGHRTKAALEIGEL